MKDNKSFLSSASLISALTSVGTPFSFPQAHRKPLGWKATTARCPCWSPLLPCSCSPLAALELYVNKTTITAIKLLILRSFQRKGLCNSGRLKALPLHTIISNNTFKVTNCDFENEYKYWRLILYFHCQIKVLAVKVV